ncbi:MAG: sulfur oxidation c-type cytochrome SoxX [Gammaproteobacteria bacterium]|nr:sulfur oxidation c-type cytochrome SoxX [Gammaproteobacteria bacterium]
MKLSASILALSLMSGVAMADGHGDAIAEGKKLAFDRGKGNCLACHMIDDGQMAGNQGPPLMMMKQRFPNIEDLRAQIADPTVRNPRTSMPPFGKHGILTEDELDKVVQYIYSL